MVAALRRVSLTAWLVVILLLGFALRLGLALGWPNFYRPDEIYQTLEPAYRLLTGWGVVSWEWREGIRSWLFPGLLAGIMAVPIRLGLGQAVYLPLVVAAMALLALLPVWAAFRMGERRFGALGAVVCGVLVAIWPPLVYFGPKTLTEVQAGNLLAAAVALATLLPSDAPKAQERRACAAVGALLGLAFGLRFHLTPALALVALVTARGRLGGRWVPLLLGAAVPLALLGVLDAATLGSAFQSVWKNFVVNVTEGRSLIYGEQPTGWYVIAWLHLLGTAAWPAVLLFLLGLARFPLAAGCAVLVVATHELFAHKELSFIYAAFPLAAINVGAGLVRLASWWGAGERTAGAFALASAVALATIGYATGDVRLLVARNADLMAIHASLRDLPADACGVVFDEKLTDLWPSYALMDRKLPVDAAPAPADYPAVAPAGNYILVRRPTQRTVAGAEKLMCWTHFCLLRRPGTCSPVPDYDFNRALERAHE